MSACHDALNIEDLRRLARSRLPRLFFEFVDRGSEDETGLDNNRRAIADIRLRPQVLVDVKGRGLESELFGRPVKFPVVISPTGIAGLLWYNGEIALARAAAAAGVPFTLATTSVTAMETVADRVREFADARLWYQLYMWEERELSYSLIERARQAEYEALVLTVDTTVAPNREYNARNGYSTSFRFNARNVLDVLRHPRWLTGTLGRYLASGGMPRFENYPKAMQTRILDPKFNQGGLISQSLTWDDLREVRRRWPRALIVKGILRADDARRAADCGADAVVVSNHGARNLDASIAPIDVLPEIIDAVGHRLTVLTDSGYRRGSDVVKALAMGARAVLIGRPTLYGVAAGGEAGAARALAIFRQEMDRTLAFLGCPRIADLSREHLAIPRRYSGGHVN